MGYVDSAAALAQAKIVPNTTADCYKVPNINTGLTIEYDSSCPGLGCFEDYPCRYVDSAAALAQVKDTGTHDDDCNAIPEHKAIKISMLNKYGMCTCNQQSGDDNGYKC